MTEMRGAGDRWLSGQQVPGVRFAHHDAVEIVGGPHDGSRGTIALLIALLPEPSYLVTMGAGSDVRVRQSAIRALTSGC